MTNQPHPPGRPFQAWLNGLPLTSRLALLEHIAAGALNAHRAVQCIVEGGPRQHETMLQLAAYLSTAVSELEAARAVVAAEMEADTGR